MISGSSGCAFLRWPLPSPVFGRPGRRQQATLHQRQERTVTEIIPLDADTYSERSSTAMRTRIATASKESRPLIARVARGAASGVVG
jgi:hypothetical protein